MSVVTWIIILSFRCVKKQQRPRSLKEDIQGEELVLILVQISESPYLLMLFFPRVSLRQRRFLSLDYYFYSILPAISQFYFYSWSVILFSYVCDKKDLLHIAWVSSCKTLIILDIISHDIWFNTWKNINLQVFNKHLYWKVFLGMAHIM